MKPTTGWVLAGVISGILFAIAAGLTYFGITVIARADENYDNLDATFFGIGAMCFIFALVFAYGGVVFLLAQWSTSRIHDPRRR